jgi:hypothetical protein
LILVPIRPPVTIVASVKVANASALALAASAFVVLVVAAFSLDSVNPVKSQ